MEKELSSRLDQVRSRIGSAASRAGRRVEDITLVAVTKVFPASAIRDAYELGLRDFGENYLQEFEGKYPQVQDLPEALRREQAHAGPLRLEQRVRRHRRAVQDVRELARRDAALLADPADAGEDALGRVGRRRRRLHAVEVARLVVDEEQVGERAADVDSEAHGR